MIEPAEDQQPDRFEPKESLREGDAVLVVDVQNDFCPGGVIPIPDADAIIPVVNEWMHAAVARGLPVVATRDWHPENHVSFEQRGGDMPPHCIQGTRGVDFHPSLDLPQDAVVISKGEDSENDQRSAFDGTTLATRLKQSGVRRIFIAGVAEELGVRDTCLDARDAGFDVCLIPNGTRPYDPTAHADAILELKDAGVHATA